MNHTLSLLLACLLCTSLCAWVLQRLTPVPAKPDARSRQLDGLRGILACLVVTHHFYYNFSWREGGMWGTKSIPIINLGAISVSLFFLMSAYLHMLKVCRSPDICWREFYISRIKRIYPLYIAVFLLVVWITLSFKPLNADNWRDFLRFTMEWLLFQNTSFQGFQSHLVIAGVQWTLVYEWAVYAVLPIIHMIYHRKINFQWAAWAAFAIGCWIISFHSQLRYYWLFLLGMPAVWLAKPVKALLQKQPALAHLVMIPLTVYLFAATKAYSWEQRLCLALWFTVLAHGYSFGGLLNLRGLTKLGDLSYAVYLIHGMVIFMWFGVWKMFPFGHGNFAAYLLHLPLVFAAAVLLSWLGNRFIEMPFARKH